MNSTTIYGAMSPTFLAQKKIKKPNMYTCMVSLRPHFLPLSLQIFTQFQVYPCWVT